MDESIRLAIAVAIVVIMALIFAYIWLKEREWVRHLNLLATEQQRRRQRRESR